MLNMMLLGQVVIQRDGKPAERFRSQTEIALLVYLGHSGQTHGREALAEILWPGRTTRQGLTNLRTALARLQPHLDAELIVSRKSLAYRPEARPYIDSVRLQTELQEFGSLSAPADVAQMGQTLRRYQGEFLAGFYLPGAAPFNDWAVVENERLRQLAIASYQRLIPLALAFPATDDPAATQEAVQRWLDLDPFNETAHSYKMRLLADSGQATAALNHYHRFVNFLAAEIGVEPTATLLNAAAQIRADLRSTHLTAVAVSPFWSSDEIIEGRGDPPLADAILRQLPLIGRAHEIQQLVKAYRRAGRKRLQVAVVSAQSGMGKSRLAAEFLNWVGSAGADVLQGQAFESAGGSPYQPMIDALRERLERENAPEDVVDDIWLAELSHILPELRARYPDLPPTADGAASTQSRLFEAVARLGLALAARQPLVWLIDDLQWADAATLDLVHYLIRRWQKEAAPILLLLLVRQEATSQPTTLADWLRRLARATDLLALHLSPIKDADLRQLIIYLAGEKAPGTARLSAWLAQETGGQPLVARETLKFLDEQGKLVWLDKNGGNGRLDPLATLANVTTLDAQELRPDSNGVINGVANNVILARLEKLSAAAADLLAAAAVIDQGSTFHMLRQTADLDERVGLNALNELLAAQLLQATTDPSRPFVVFHDLIRETVYAKLSQPQRQRLHDRALMSLAPAGNSPALLAHHAVSAHQWPAAFHYSLAAGEAAKAVYALATAVEHFEAALNRLRQKQAVEEEAVVQRLFLQLGRSYELQFQLRKALAIYEEMTTWAVNCRCQAMELAALIARCGALSLPYDAYDAEQAAELMQQAVPLARARGDLKAEAQLELIQVQLHKYGDGQLAPALAHAQTAVSLARQAGQNEQLALALINLASLDASSGQLERAESSLKQAEQLFRAANHQPKLQDVFHSLAMIRLGAGRFAEALTYLDQANQVNEALNSPTEQLALIGTRNVVHLIRGEYGRVLTSLQPLLESHETEIVARVRVESQQQLAWAYGEIGAYDEGVKHCQRAIADHKGIERNGRVPAFAILALLLIAQGQLAEAALALAEGLAYFDLQQIIPGWWWESPSILLAQATLALAQGDPARARQIAGQLLRKYDELKLRHLKPEVLTFQARVMRALGNDKSAQDLLTEALALADEMGARRGLWATCWALGELKAGQGEWVAAARLRARGREEALFVAEQIDETAYKAVFLDRSDVQQVVGEPLTPG
jgi:DNA-binding SARP family transcriptional activator